MLIFLSSSFFACQRHNFNTDTDARLLFSVDTVSFDTVFTTVGSATLHFKVYNTYKQDLEIDEIKLVGGSASSYRINIDGAPELAVSNKLLRAKDSMYIFVDVNIDPKNKNLPFLVEDNILFNTNGAEQKVLLQSYGQDAHHVKIGKWGDVGLKIDQNEDGSYDTTKVVQINADTLLVGDKPYLIYDHFVVAEGVELKLDAGVKFFIHKNKNIDIYGTLISNGTIDNPVILRGSRTDNLFDDTPYDKVPGQWGTLTLQRKSYDNYFKHTHIRNGFVGLSVDSTKVKLENCRIESMTNSAICSYESHIVADNSIFANCEKNLLLAEGGKFSFTNCTFANHYEWGGHTSPSLILKNYVYKGEEQVAVNLEEANFVNCIISGTTSSELWFDEAKEEVLADFNYSFENCLIKTNVSAIDTNDVRFSDIIWNKDPLFREPEADWDFHPDTLSPVIDAGKITHLTSDLNEMPYIDAPEIGALEYAGTLPEEKDEE